MGIKKAYGTAARGVLCNISGEFGISVKLLTLLKTCLYETYSKVCICQNLRGILPNENGLKQGNGFSSLLFSVLH
jgi:hypothetical protein